MIMTPGQYIARRRRAAGLSVEDVAAAVRTDPVLGEIDRVQWLRRVEDDIVAPTSDVLRSLGPVFPFSPDVLEQLIELASFGEDTLEAPRLCHICGCSEHDACRMDDGNGCAWAGPDTCTNCTAKREAA